MAGESITLGTGQAQVRITGLRATVRALQDAGADMADMPQVMHALGQLVADAARPRVPRVSGRLAASVRAGKGKTRAVVRMGGARVVYAPVIHYGWPARNIRPQPVLTDAYRDTLPRVLDQLEDELGQILTDHNLDTD